MLLSWNSITTLSGWRWLGRAPNPMDRTTELGRGTRKDPPASGWGPGKFWLKVTLPCIRESYNQSAFFVSPLTKRACLVPVWRRKGGSNPSLFWVFFPVSLSSCSIWSPHIFWHPFSHIPPITPTMFYKVYPLGIGVGEEGVAAAALGASLSRKITAAQPAPSGKSLNVSAELNQMLIPCGERICWNLQGSSWQQENALIHSQICFGQAGCDLDCKAALNHKVLCGSHSHPLCR